MMPRHEEVCWRAPPEATRETRKRKLAGERERGSEATTIVVIDFFQSRRRRPARLALLAVFIPPSM